MVSVLVGMSASAGLASAARHSRHRFQTRRRSGNPQSGMAPPQAQAILDDVADRLWDRGDFYWHEGRYEERVALDRLVIRVQPRFIEPYGTAGWLLESLGRKNEALAMYRQG